MKSIFIAFDQAHQEKIVEILEHAACRGYTFWEEVKGRGSNGGDPHYGSHAWPSLAGAIITIVPDDRVDHILRDLKALDDERPKLGLRAFVTPVERMI